jgi:hypothetical protein
MSTVTLTFKTTAAKARALRLAAKARKMTLSDYLRRAADQAAIAQAPGRSLRPVHDLTPGRVIIQAASDASPISSEMVAAALYD